MSVFRFTILEEESTGCKNQLSFEMKRLDLQMYTPTNLIEQHMDLSVNEFSIIEDTFRFTDNHMEEVKFLQRIMSAPEEFSTDNVDENQDVQTGKSSNDLTIKIISEYFKEYDND